MPIAMLWMALGIAVVAWLPLLPSFAQLAGLVAASAMCAICLCWLAKHMASRNTGYAIAIALIAATLGFSWGCAYGYCIRAGLLAVELEQQSLLCRGRIVGLVEQREGFTRKGEAAPQPVLHFQFALDANQTSASQHLPRLLQLNWYDAKSAPQPGEYWQLRVKLKRPRGFANAGGFDYEAWLVANRIGATGYVERGSDNQKLAAAPWWSIDALRGRAQNYLNQRLQAFAHRDLLLGLLLGDGGAIATEEWDTFRATGTVHLFVVSGLQIAFTGGLALWCARLWWRGAWSASRRRNYLFGAIPALLVALIYALLAGWGVPIQRALIMFTVLLWTLVARRQIRASTSWIAALWVVLVFDPLAVRDIGFWFSFVAVAAILLMICGHRERVAMPLVRHALRWWRIQLALFATSLPLLLLLSGQLTLLALPANLIAIPLSTFISLPLAFLAALADGLLPQASDLFWRGADLSLEVLWRYLCWLQQHSQFAIWHPRGIANAICIFVAIAAVLWLLPRGTPGKAFAVIFCVPLLAPPLAPIAQGACTVTVVDVGQGLSVLIETAQHTLLYDTGALFGERTVADVTVIPTLRQRGVAALDMVVVSHNDSDHAGGWPAIAREFAVHELLLGEAITPIASAASIPTQFCQAGMHWHWDGVDFEVLYPSPDNHFAGNNHSCVLQINAGAARILLTGDIERSGEYGLLDNPALQPATLLLAPHHGSRSSSTQALIERLQPEYVVFSTGYFNRFGHPHQEVVERYRQYGAELFDTAFTGAVTFMFAPEHVAQISAQRLQSRHYWN